MRKEFEIQGCVEVPIELSKDEFYNKFITFIECNNWSFGGGINEIIDGFLHQSRWDKRQTRS